MKLPLCAWCAQPLARGEGRCTATAKFVRGQPTVGWHAEKCLDADPIALPTMHSEIDLVAAIERVDDRGSGRVTSSVPWKPVRVYKRVLNQ